MQNCDNWLNLQQNTVCSVQKIYQSPAKFYTSTACSAYDILHVRVLAVLVTNTGISYHIVTKVVVAVFLPSGKVGEGSRGESLVRRLGGSKRIPASI